MDAPTTPRERVLGDVRRRATDLLLAVMDIPEPIPHGVIAAIGGIIDTLESSIFLERFESKKTREA